MTSHHPHPHHPPAHHTPAAHDATDAWHDHSHDERPQTSHGEINKPGLVIGIGFALFLAVVLAVVVVDNFYKWYSAQQLREAEVASGPNSPAIEARDFKSKALAGHVASEPSWIIIPATPTSPAQAMPKIPLAIAQDMVIREYAARMGGSAGVPKAQSETPNTPSGAPTASR